MRKTSICAFISSFFAHSMFLLCCLRQFVPFQSKMTRKTVRQIHWVGVFVSVETMTMNPVEEKERERKRILSMCLVWFGRLMKTKYRVNEEKRRKKQHRFCYVCFFFFFFNSHPNIIQYSSLLLCDLDVFSKSAHARPIHSKHIHNECLVSLVRQPNQQN